MSSKVLPVELKINSTLPRTGESRRSDEFRRAALCEALGIRQSDSRLDVSSLPFAPGDATAGTENELQAEVAGFSNQVDLPVSIRRSRYFANLTRRVGSDEAPRQLAAQVHRYLSDRNGVWENSWVRFPKRNLTSFARDLLQADLENNNGIPRSDLSRFSVSTAWGDWLRVSISYLLRLALAGVLGEQPRTTASLPTMAPRMLNHFLNDLTSPETYSFYVVNPALQPLGESAATEMSRRFLLTHLLLEWANKAIDLESLGQRASLHFSPHPPVRQQELNDCISDSFYSELFVNPCLGWTDGEIKQEYMRLAYRTISRSRINAVIKLKDAGLIPNNLVVLPNTSSASLANNGTHLSLGSKRLSGLLADNDSSFQAADEKYLGDLVIKISEHFLPLFVSTYTAAPYRLAFADLLPERALGFLPHALDYTQLRMLWRHWKGKADIRFFGRPISPHGPAWLDDSRSALFRLRGDLVPDYRLIDFPVAWLCTEEASALDGMVGNVARLSSDLDAMGVVDHRLKFYMPISLRNFSAMGFSGFEARHYSVFESFADDFAPAASLQQLITMLAYKLALSGKYGHANTPNDPPSESERRLPFFYAALGLPAFNARVATPNDLLRRVVSLTGATTNSRHRGYLRVPLLQYQLALVRIIEEEGADIIELLQLKSTIADLKKRLLDSNRQTYGRLLRGITGHDRPAGALGMRAREFNLAAENYYRGTLKQKLLREALDNLRTTCEAKRSIPESLYETCDGVDLVTFLRELEQPLLNDRLRPAELYRLINVVLTVIANEMTDPSSDSPDHLFTGCASTSIHRSAHAASA